MTDQTWDEAGSQSAVADEPAGSESPDPTYDVRTGDPRVDAVLDSLDGLDHAPVEAHVPVFERAHEQLRAALEAKPPAD